MNKEDWEKLYGILNDAYFDFSINYEKMKNGSNKKIRERAEYDVDNAINVVTNWINKYPESFDLLTGKDANPFNKQIVWDEFVLPRYFNTDMKEFLNKINEKIKSLDV